MTSGLAYRSMSPEECRRHARECLRIAESVPESQTRDWLIDMAYAWSQLAHQADKNRDTLSAG